MSIDRTRSGAPQETVSRESFQEVSVRKIRHLLIALLECLGNGKKNEDVMRRGSLAKERIEEISRKLSDIALEPMKTAVMTMKRNIGEEVDAESLNLKSIEGIAKIEQALNIKLNYFPYKLDLTTEDGVMELAKYLGMEDLATRTFAKK